MRRFLMGFAAVGALSCALPAQAEDRTLSSFGKLNNSLKLELTGRIVERCSLGQGADIDFGRLERQGVSRTVSLALDCNVPFSLKLQAGNGALVHETLPRGQGPFAGSLPYTVELFTRLIGPSGTSSPQFRFAPDELLAGGTASSQGQISNGPLQLQFTTSDPQDDGLLAGKYSETLTVTIQPQM